MPLALFESLSALVVVLTLAVMWVSTPSADRLAVTPERMRLVADCALLAIAAWLGEQSAITAYRHYAYAPGWHLRVGDVPLLVPLVWPLVILSARSVRRALVPDAGPIRGALAIFGLVCVDASLIEVLATRAGLWTWAEEGHLGVPVMGIVAWGLFAAAADGMLDRLRGPARLLVVPGSVLLAHTLIAAIWWYALKWTLRGPLGDASVFATVALGIGATGLALRSRRRGRLLSRSVVGPRLLATALFVALFLTTAANDWRLGLHLLSVAVPYWAATDVRTLVRAR